MNEIKITKKSTGQTNIGRSRTKFGMTKRCAFTLAEVLITLGIIGVVAAITIPMFTENMNIRVKTKRIENIKQKLSKVTDKMASINKLQGYSSTRDFVDEMKNHMRIAKICYDHVEECWPVSEVAVRTNANDDKSKTAQIASLTTPEMLKLSSDDNWTKPVGIITGDGTSMIISYNKNCSISSDTGLIYDHASATSNSLSCIAGIYDWNGKARPNVMGEDVQSLGMAGIKVNDGCDYMAKDGSICISGSPHLSIPMMYAECLARKDELGIQDCFEYDDSRGGDSWAGAVRDCGGVENMLSASDVLRITNYIYDGYKVDGGYECDGSSKFFLGIPGTFNAERAMELGIFEEPYEILYGDSRGQCLPIGNEAYPKIPGAFHIRHNDYGGALSLVICKGDKEITAPLPEIYQTPTSSGANKKKK